MSITPPSWSKTSFKKIILAIFLIHLALPAVAKPDRTALTENQRLFLEAYDAILAKDRKLIASYKKRLADYPLGSYITFFDIYKNLNDTPNNLIEHFIEQNKDHNHLAARIKRLWLAHLGQTQQWALFLKHYQADEFVSQDLQCYATTATLNLVTDNDAKTPIHTQAQITWKTGKPHTKACSPLDRYLRKNKLITGSMIWDNINLAIQRNQIRYATQLATDLSPSERKIYQDWLKIIANPALLKNPLSNEIPGQVRQNIFVNGIKSLSKKKPRLANELLELHAVRYGLSATETSSLKATISLRLARTYKDDAKQLLSDVNESDSNEDTLRWQLQLALRESDWATVLEVYEKVDVDEQSNAKWQYWLARSYEETNQVYKSTKIYKSLAEHRNYYGFLAADKLKQDYRFNPTPNITVDTEELIKKYPQLQRIKELLAVQWALNANREWYHLLDTANSNELEAIGYLANDWQQHSIAIRSLAKGENWNNIILRFPTPHKEPVLQAAQQHNVDPAWVYGVMRRESAFNSEVRSPVGAIGLMQLMPDTARFIGKRIGSKTYQNLTNAESNIELGSAYLSYLNTKYDGNRILATAAYNAGPGRIDSWIPTGAALPADQWVDSIPFNETRRYVKAVLEYTTIFQSLIHQRYDRLENNMTPIGLARNK